MYGDCSAFRLRRDAVPYSVFHNGLQRQRRQQEIGCADLIYNMQARAEPQLFQAEIMLHMLQLL